MPEIDVPVPDPTLQTTRNLLREIEHLRELMEARLDALFGLLGEREKSGRALRDELERLIETGDNALGEHVAQQIAQVREALSSSERLELARVEHLRELVDNVRREVEANHAAAEQAISKTESANDRRFESVNEFRAQLADQTATFMPREVADTQFADLRRAIAELTEKLGKVVS